MRIFNDIPFEQVFVNREKELAELTRHTAEPGSLLFLCGPAGVGKTALLNIFVLRYAEKFEGGWLRIDASKFNFKEEYAETLKPSKEGQRLIIIDNAESISDHIIYEIARQVQRFKADSIIISGRIKPEDPKLIDKTIYLSGL